LKSLLKRVNAQIPGATNKISLTKPLQIKKEIKQIPKIPEKAVLPKSKLKSGIIELPELDKETIKRLKKKEKKIVKEKSKKPRGYVKLSSKFCSKFANSLADKKMFKTLSRDLIKANLQFTPTSYVSTIIFTTILSAIAAIFLIAFFLFFSICAMPPFITFVTESLASRFFKVIWLLLIFPIATFFMMYVYPSLEKKAAEIKVNQELPFATIHMAAISGSMIDPTKIFTIIVSTKDYPAIEKEFIKVVNEINIYGYNLVDALRRVAFKNPSAKLAELFNGLATTITSGGDLQDYFEKRAQSLLFEHRLEKEKATKSAETFMDIYISVVIAAPMILMLLLMIMKISGLGIALSTSMITLVMVLGVSIVNIAFLTFLHLKQPAE